MAEMLSSGGFDTATSLDRSPCVGFAAEAELCCCWPNNDILPEVVVVLEFAVGLGAKLERFMVAACWCVTVMHLQKLLADYASFCGVSERRVRLAFIHLYSIH